MIAGFLLFLCAIATIGVAVAWWMSAARIVPDPVRDLPEAWAGGYGRERFGIFLASLTPEGRNALRDELIPLDRVLAALLALTLAFAAGVLGPEDGAGAWLVSIVVAAAIVAVAADLVEGALTRSAIDVGATPPEDLVARTSAATILKWIAFAVAAVGVAILFLSTFTALLVIAMVLAAAVILWKLVNLP